MADAVLQLLGPSTGGIRRHVAFLTAQLRDRGWTVATAGPAGVLEGLQPQDHVVPVPAGLALGRLPTAWRRLRALFDRYDIVHAHGLTAGWVAALARPRRSKTALVVTVHNLVLDDVAGRRAPVLRFLERRLPARADAVIAVSPDVAGHFADAPGGDRVVVGGAFGPPPRPSRTPAQVRRSLGVGDSAPLVVCVARLHPQKGLDVLLDAFASVPTRVAGARLAIVGDGPLAADLRAHASRLAVDVVFAQSANGADELAAADVVAIPSRWESGPLVLGEAMLLGRPVVATPVGTVTELLTDGETGWLVPVGAATALADALVAALTDPGEAARRAEAGRLRATATLDPAPRVSVVEAAYRASLGRR